MNDILYRVLEKRIPVQNDVKIRADGDHYLMLSPVWSVFISLNRMAGNVYYFCDGKRTIGDIVSIFKKQYSTMPSKKIQEDICKCMSDLESVHAISVIKK